MSYWTGPALALLQSRKGIRHRWALTALPKTFAGAVSPIALWSGVTDFVATLDGTQRTYRGIGAALLPAPIRYRAGTEVQTTSLALPLTQRGEDFVRGLDTRLAPVQLHCLLFDPLSGDYLEARRYWKGFIDSVTIALPDPDGVTQCTLSLASSARRGTMNTAGKKSDKSQRQRDPGDAFRRYGGHPRADDPWGTQDD